MTAPPSTAAPALATPAALQGTNGSAMHAAGVAPAAAADAWPPSVTVARRCREALRRGAAPTNWTRWRRGRCRRRSSPPRHRRGRCRRQIRCRRRCPHCPCSSHSGCRAPVFPRGNRCLPLVRRTQRRPRAASGMAMGARGGHHHGAFGSIGHNGAPGGRRWHPDSVLCGGVAAGGGRAHRGAGASMEWPWAGRRRRPPPSHALATSLSARVFLLMGCTRRRRRRHSSGVVRRPAAAGDAAGGGASSPGSGRRQRGGCSVCRLHRQCQSRQTDAS